ncbi:MAG: hypothetical protein A2X31_13575 [Elusimicrobia bacterium GWB2_63_22]|nr:MAG: hypothetical protein A2X31_13575 [Elusimicrobia bacterium GWB2_63_22]
MKTLSALAGLLFLAFPAAAAGPADGIAAAAEEALLRDGGGDLVEIEGFAGPDGNIPCSRGSYSNSWHYKFYAAGDWLQVNACGPNVLNSARHRPYSRANEPDRRLPASFAPPAEVLKKLAADKIFTPAPNPYDRDVLMRIRLLPAKDGRPEGCYWYVAQGRAKALTDCDAAKAWKLGGAPAPKAGKLQGPAAKGIDTAGRYVQRALDTIPRKALGARLMLIESLVDRNGSAKCIEPKDGWSYVFALPGKKASSAFAGCRGKTTSDYVLFDGANAGDIDKLDPIAPPFKDSDFALSQVPKDCVKGYATLSMKLQNFKPRYSPFAGHSLVWTIDCGSKRHIVDGHTGRYLGPGSKTPIHQ